MKSPILFVILVAMLSGSFLNAQQELPSDFPVFKNTGNQEEDNERYNAQKLAWIEANPELYRQMGGQIKPKPVTNPEPEELDKIDCLSKGELTIAIPPNAESWVITDANILDSEKQLATAELNKQIEEFKTEMLSHKLVWKMSSDNILYMLQDGNYANHFIFEKTDDQLRLLPPSDKLCNQQSKTYLIQSWTESQIDINIPAEDEGSKLIYQFSLTPGSD